MENSKIIKLKNRFIKKEKTDIEHYQIYTPKIMKKYKECYKFTMKITQNKDKTMFIMYKNVKEWYKEKNINLKMEKIHIKSKLGSYESGGCGIGASLLAGLTASGVCSYMDIYIKKLGFISIVGYASLVLLVAIKILVNEDDTVEMYNMFLEVISEIEKEDNS